MYPVNYSSNVSYANKTLFSRPTPRPRLYRSQHQNQDRNFHSFQDQGKTLFQDQDQDFSRIFVLKSQITHLVSTWTTTPRSTKNIPAPYIIRSLAICLLLIIAFDGILCLLLQLLVSFICICICMICVFLCVFYVYFMCIWAKCLQ